MELTIKDFEEHIESVKTNGIDIRPMITHLLSIPCHNSSSVNDSHVNEVKYRLIKRLCANNKDIAIMSIAEEIHILQSIDGVILGASLRGTTIPCEAWLWIFEIDSLYDKDKYERKRSIRAFY